MRATCRDAPPLAECGSVMHMNADRTERITVNMTPELLEKLDGFAERNRWTRSTAATILIERSLEGEQR